MAGNFNFLYCAKFNQLNFFKGIAWILNFQIIFPNRNMVQIKEKKQK